MNHPGEIRSLVAMVRPHLALHYYHCRSAYWQFFRYRGNCHAKAEIFQGVVAGGAALINGDNEFADFLEDHARSEGN